MGVELQGEATGHTHTSCKRLKGDIDSNFQFQNHFDNVDIEFFEIDHLEHDKKLSKKRVCKDVKKYF